MTTLVKQRTSTAAKALYLILMGLAVVGIGTIMGFIGGANKGYSGLNRPTFTPPDIVFSIAWSILYFGMGAAFYLILQEKPLTREARIGRNSAITLFIVQLVLNLVWPIVFFRAEMYLVAFVWLAVLTALVTALMLVTFKVNKAAAIIFIPYLAWLIFATYLNLMILVYN